MAGAGETTGTGASSAEEGSGAIRSASRCEEIL